MYVGLDSLWTSTSRKEDTQILQLNFLTNTYQNLNSGNLLINGLNS